VATIAAGHAVHDTYAAFLSTWQLFGFRRGVEERSGGASSQRSTCEVARESPDSGLGVSGNRS
jgi:hypothetical protein